MALTPAEKQRRYRERKAVRSQPLTDVGPATPRPKKVTPRSGKLGSTLDEIEANVARLKKQAENVERSKTATARDKATVGRALQSALDQLRAARGDEELSEARIVKSAAFARIVDAFTRVATEHPGPWVGALRKALEGLP